MSCRLLNIFMTLILGALLIPGLSLALDAYPDVGYGRVDGYSAVGRRSAEFLSVPVSARSVAMGDAYTAVVDDISAIHYNPAGLGFLQETQFMFTRVNMPSEVRYNYAAAATPLADGTWIVGAFYGMLSMDPIEETTILFPNGTGSQVDVYSQVLGGTVAYNFSDRFSAGVVVKHVYEDYWGVTAQAVAFDVGSNYHTELLGREFRLGLSIQNLGSGMEFRGSRLQTIVDPGEIPQESEQAGEVNRDPRPQRRLEYRTTGNSLPTVFKAGASMVMATSSSYNWVIGVDLMQPNNIPVTFAAGTEITTAISDALTGAVRLGWRMQTDQDEDALSGSLYGDGTSVRGLSFGGGLLSSFDKFNVGFDYAYRNMGYLDSNHYFSLRIGF